MNKKDKFADTPLDNASTYKNHEIAKLLIGAGADFNAQDSVGSTALHTTARTKKVECLKLLIDSSSMYLNLQAINWKHRITYRGEKETY